MMRLDYAFRFFFPDAFRFFFPDAFRFFFYLKFFLPKIFSRKFLFAASPCASSTFTQCALCGALRDDSERSLCCMHGACLFLSDAFPDHGEAFKELCVSTQDLSDISRALNNRLAFASIGSDYDRDRVRFPWEYRQATAKPFPGPMYRGPG